MNRGLFHSDYLTSDYSRGIVLDNRHLPKEFFYHFLKLKKICKKTIRSDLVIICSQAETQMFSQNSKYNLTFVLNIFNKTSSWRYTKNNFNRYVWRNDKQDHKYTDQVCFFTQHSTDKFTQTTQIKMLLCLPFLQQCLSIRSPHRRSHSRGTHHHFHSLAQRSSKDGWE